MSQVSARLYLITPPRLPDVAAFAVSLRSALEAGDVACLQLRLKDVDDAKIREATHFLMPICHEFDVAFIMNDSPELAKELGCDGVHVGEDDTPYDEARRIVGKDAIVGVTCYDSRHRAMELGDKGADYVAFGAFFDTETKDPKTRVEPEILQIWTTFTTVPCVAIGGITAENCGPLVQSGADFLAVSSGIWSHPDGPAEAIKAFLKTIEANTAQ